MKKGLSVVALLMAVVMIAMCCVACGGDKATVVGKWTTEFDFDKYLSSASSAGEGFEQMLDMMKEGLAGLKLKIYIEFKEDGSAELTADKDSSKNVADKMMETLSAVLVGMGMTEDQITAILAQMDPDSMMQDLKAKYETDGNKLYLYQESEGKKDDRYVEYEVTSSELKITKVVGDVDNIPAELLPLTLTKVN